MLEAIAAGDNDIRRLAERFGVSFSTVRRDLCRLAGEKIVARTYGGAMLTIGLQEDSYTVRERLHRSAKQSIARTAAREVNDGETIILDGGSTVTCMAHYLRKKNLTVITNNIKVTALLAGVPNITLILLGGFIRPISISTYGHFAEESLRCLTADKLFTSANGVVANRGLCEASLEQVAVKRLMICQARETFVLADASKLGCASQPAWAQFPPKWTLVTEANEPLCRSFVEDGATVLRALCETRPEKAVYG